MTAGRNSYHTNVILLYREGLLPCDLLEQIPYSTRYNWKRRDTSYIFGSQDLGLSPGNIEMVRELIAQRQLFPALKALIRINNILLRSIQMVRGYRKILSGSSKKIIRIIERFKDHIGIRRITKWAGISLQQFHYWKRNAKRCPSSLMELCRTKHPHQLTTKETKVIRNYATNPAFASWSMASIYFRILRDAEAFFALSTFYLYLRRLGISKKFHSYKIRKEGIRASRPGELIHADITEYRLKDSRKVYIYHFADNFSRFPLRCMASFQRSPEITLHNLEMILTDYPQLFKERFTLLVDDGVENKGALSDFASNNREFILLLVAMKDIMLSNSMIEARNRSLKIEYLKDREFYSLEALQTFLDAEYLENYRNRPLKALEGFTPSEVLYGAIPEKHRFADNIAAAKRDRIAENQAFDCKTCSTESGPG